MTAATGSKRSAGATHNATTPAPTPDARILALLQLDKVAIVDQLKQVIASFRSAQTTQLLDLLEALESDHALDHVVAYFDRKLDVKSEMERYLHDLLKMHHYTTHHGVETDLTRRMMQLYGTFGNIGDRQLLTKVFQTLGFSLCTVYCALCNQLTPRLQQELLTLFADDLSDLRMWIQWLAAVRKRGDSNNNSVAATTTIVTSDSEEAVDVSDTNAVAGSAFDDALQLIAKTITERCAPSWLSLLRPLSHAARVAVVCELNKHLPSSSLKQLARYYETTGDSLQSYLELDRAVCRSMATLLNEFPAAALQTLFAKFNSANIIACVRTGLDMLPKRELLRLIDALGIADFCAIDIFVSALFQYKRLELFAPLFLTFATQSQLHFLTILRDVAAPAASLDDSNASDDCVHETVETTASERTAAAWRVFDLFLDAHFHSFDAVIQKLSTLSSAATRQMVAASAAYTSDDLGTLGDGIERITSCCLPSLLCIFASLPPASRVTLVQWVRAVPDDAALPIYAVLLALLPLSSQATADTGSRDSVATSSSDDSDRDVAVKMLELLSALTQRDKRLLCTEVLVRDQQQQPHYQRSAASEAHTLKDALSATLTLNTSVLRYLCDCAMPPHKAIKLFRLLPTTEYANLIFLLRTQRLAEQVALARLMLSLPSEPNCRLLAKVQSLLTSDTLDLFFELLLLIPAVEYRSFTKLLVSPNVSHTHLQCFVQVASSLMNQASSRELVLFTADLPVLTRNLFFDMLMHEPVKGVVLRIVACTSKLSPELLHALIALLHPLSWSTRSSLIEQIRALESTQDVEQLVDVAQALAIESADVERLVLLLNVLQVPVRTCLVVLLLPLSCDEKQRTLAKLDALPKAALQALCVQVCASPMHHPAAVGSAFLRVFGLLDSVYQLALLALLQHASCWPLLTLLADCAAHTPEPSLLNGFATTLALLPRENELLLLCAVVEEALATATSLHVLVLVLCHFRTPPTLLVFLRFAQHVGRVARSTVFFRVLAQYEQTVFLFAMCCLLDLDDALFVLTRLDRLSRLQRSQTLHVELDNLAQRFTVSGSVEIKDEFCNVIAGFHERSVTASVSPPAAAPTDSRFQPLLRIVEPRCVLPQSAHSVAIANDMSSDLHWQEYDGANIDSDANSASELFTPTTRLITKPALSLERHLRRAQSEDTFVHRWSQIVAPVSNVCMEAAVATSAASTTAVDELNAVVNNRVDGGACTIAGRHPETATEPSSLAAQALESCGSATNTATRDASASATAIESSSLPSIASNNIGTGSSRPQCSSSAASIEPTTSPRDLALDDPHDSSYTSADDKHVGNAAAPSRSRCAADVLTILPPLNAQPPVLRAKRSVGTNARINNDAAPSVSLNVCVQPLSHAESAPTTLRETGTSQSTSSPSERVRRYRGLVAALDASQSSDCHVVRDRGASIFRKECEAAVEANTASRIRVAKTLAAQTHVNAVRAQHALGTRDVHHCSSATLPSPLLRPDRHTFEQATATLALAAKARQVDMESLCHSIK